MNQALQEKLVELLDLGKTGLLGAFDAIKAQAPGLVEQILRWNFTLSLMGFLLGFFFILVIYYIYKILKPKYTKCCEENRYVDFPPPAVIFVFVIPCIIIGCSNLEWLKILIAPKLFIVEYVAGLIK